MKRLIKIAIFGVLGLVAILGVGVFLLVANSGKLVKTATERVLSYVLEVDVTMDRAEIKLTEGEVGLYGFKVANPEGYDTVSAFEFETIEVKADLKSFATDYPTINLITIRGPKITLEQAFTESNLTRLIDSASRLDVGGGEEKVEPEPAADEPEGAGKKVIVERVVLEGATVALAVKALSGEQASFTLPRIEMTDLGGGDEPVSIAGAIKEFLTEILRQSLGSGGGIMPEDLKRSISESIEGAKEQIAEKRDEIEQDLGEKKAELEEKVEDKKTEIKENITDKIEEEKDKLKGLFSRRDEEEEQ